MSVSMSRYHRFRPFEWASTGVVLASLLLSACSTLPALHGQPAAKSADEPASKSAGVAATDLTREAKARTDAKPAPDMPARPPQSATVASATPVPSPGMSATETAAPAELPVVDLPTPALPGDGGPPPIPEPPPAAISLLKQLPPIPPVGAVHVAVQERPAAVRAPDSTESAASAPSSPAAVPKTSVSPSRPRPLSVVPPATSAPPATNEPAAATVARPQAAAKSASQAAASGASSGSAAGRGAGAASKGAESAGGATGKRAGKSGEARPPGSGSTTRAVYAKVGDDITIALNGEGWTFTGGGATGDGWKGGVQYESRSLDSGGTTFIFKAKALGKWVLDFQQQNAGSGATTNETIKVEVLTGSEFARKIAAAPGSGASSSSPGANTTAQNSTGIGGDLAAADWLYKEGKYVQALDAYERAWHVNDPALTDKIAELAYRVGRYQDARRYWQMNFGMQGTSYGELATAGLMKTATAQRDAPELRALFDRVHTLHGVPIRFDLLDAAKFLYDARQWEVALRYLEEYLNRYKGGEGADVADYYLGKIYSGDTPMQDARTAMEYFRRIVTDYPTSDYYELARANMVYLNRNYFEIR